MFGNYIIWSFLFPEVTSWEGYLPLKQTGLGPGPPTNKPYKYPALTGNLGDTMSAE